MLYIGTDEVLLKIVNPSQIFIFKKGPESSEVIEER